MLCRVSRLGAFAIASLYLAGCLLAAPTAVLAQGPNTVSEIIVTGNQNINTDTIRNVITLKPGDEVTDQAIEKDKAAIMSLDYFSAVTVRQEKTAEGVKVTYEVTENPKITGIKIVGNGPVTEAQILSLMKTKAGQVLNTGTLNQDVQSIQEYYSSQGYLGYVTADIGVDPATGVLTVPILVAKVESVSISGSKKTKPYVILREMKTKPGAVFNMKVLGQDIMRIYNLDILESIKEPVIDQGSEIGLVKITLPVVEKKTGQVSVGLGYSSRQRLVGQARLSETNFQGKGQGLNLLWEQGTTDAVGGRSSYEATFFEPWIDKQHTSLSVSAYNKVLYRFSSGVFNSGTFADDETYNERHKGGDVTLSRPLTETLRAYVGGRFENVESNPDLLNQVGSDLGNIAQTGDVGSGSLRFVHNTRDLEQDPAAGGYEALALELGSTDGDRFEFSEADNKWNPVPFNGTFNKTSLDLRRYFSKGGRRTSPNEKRTTIAVRLRGGVASGTLPFFEQFFVGGAESLRGYREDRFWGTKMLLASVEFRKPIAQSISGVLFVDYGDAWGAEDEFIITELPQHKSFKGFLGYGVGMRVTTPIGYLRLDYGIGDEGGRTYFSMGQAF